MIDNNEEIVSGNLILCLDFDLKFVYWNNYYCLMKSMYSQFNSCNY